MNSALKSVAAGINELAESVKDTTPAKPELNTSSGGDELNNQGAAVTEPTKPDPAAAGDVSTTEATNNSNQPSSEIDPEVQRLQKVNEYDEKISKLKEELSKIEDRDSEEYKQKEEEIKSAEAELGNLKGGRRRSRRRNYKKSAKRGGRKSAKKGGKKHRKSAKKGGKKRSYRKH